jgi:aldehyde:ferredoxin oxidoreductase
LRQEHGRKVICYADHEQQYELKDAVYHRRGWTSDGIPTLETVKRLGIDFPEVVTLLQAGGVTG